MIGGSSSSCSMGLSSSSSEDGGSARTGRCCGSGRCWAPGGRKMSSSWRASRGALRPAVPDGAAVVLAEAAVGVAVGGRESVQVFPGLPLEAATTEGPAGAPASTPAALVAAAFAAAVPGGEAPRGKAPGEFVVGRSVPEAAVVEEPGGTPAAVGGAVAERPYAAAPAAAAPAAAAAAAPAAAPAGLDSRLSSSYSSSESWVPRRRGFCPSGGGAPGVALVPPDDSLRRYRSILFAVLDEPRGWWEGRWCR